MIQSLGFIAIMMNIDMWYLSSTYQQGVYVHIQKMMVVLILIILCMLHNSQEGLGLS